MSILMAADDPRHGTRDGYREGCHCGACRRAVALAANLYKIRRAANGGRPLMVDKLGSVRRLRSLMALGWPRRELARRAGYMGDAFSPILNGDRRWVWLDTAQRVCELYERLSMTQGPSNPTRIYARKAGWSPPLSWDEGAIDDPRAFPDWSTVRCDVRNCDGTVEARRLCTKHYLAERRPTAGTRTWSIEDRLETYLDKIPGGCWVWTGARNQFGYGSMRGPDGTVATHRFVYELHLGPVPEGLVLDHLCRVRSCANPDHLEAVTAQVNIDRGLRAASDTCQNGHPFDLLAGTRQERRCSTCETAKRSARTARDAQRRVSDRHADLDDLLERGVGVHEAARVLGCTVSALEKWADRHGRRQDFNRLVRRERGAA